MVEIFSEWNSLAKRLKGAYLYLFLDCDGTITPIAETPQETVITRKTIDIISQLCRLSRMRLAIISGRSLADVKRLIGLDGMIYVGNHGLEVSGPGITSRWEPPAEYKEELAGIKTALKREFAKVSGIILEDKGLSLSLHYRKAKLHEEAIKKAFHEVTAPYARRRDILVMEGKKVFEIMPAAGLNKGKIVKWLLARERLVAGDGDITAMYVGDDRTDEDAFRALGAKGISVLVGSRSASSAAYYVENTDEVQRLLTMILELKSGQRPDFVI